MWKLTSRGTYITINAHTSIGNDSNASLITCSNTSFVSVWDDDCEDGDDDDDDDDDDDAECAIFVVDIC